MDFWRRWRILASLVKIAVAFARLAVTSAGQSIHRHFLNLRLLELELVFGTKQLPELVEILKNLRADLVNFAVQFTWLRMQVLGLFQV